MEEREWRGDGFQGKEMMGVALNEREKERMVSSMNSASKHNKTKMNNALYKELNKQMK